MLFLSEAVAKDSLFLRKAIFAIFAAHKQTIKLRTVG